ncbi:MAG TPA: enoyl-CoA hydratase/isomerase [Rhizomicrobium sp.]|nr:enoyl-CoA hydratase/isomerase [Rhizomicrobium sp.]
MRKDFERAYITVHGPIAVLTMNHPQAMNAVSPKMAGGLISAIDHIEASDAIRAVVLTGEGKAFCSGHNLTETPASESARDPGFVLETSYHPLLRRLRNLRMPLIVAVNGVAAGIGMSYALLGDLILAARSAYFLQAFARIGLIPDGGATWLLPRIIGTARARELSLLAERLSAETALEWGLINRVYDDGSLMDEALKLAHRLAEGPTASLSMIRQLYWASLNNSLEEQIDLECQMQRRAGRSEDAAEGAAAFRQKRPPNFKGR